MFSTKTYVQRRKQLKETMKSGLLLFLGNEESPMNYSGNQYHFRQDSTFLYYFGLDLPNLAAVVDIDNDREIIFGDDFGVDDIVWMGPQPKVNDLAAQIGVAETQPMADLQKVIIEAIGKADIHYLPPYRAEQTLKLGEIFGVIPSWVKKYVSVSLIKAVVEQRNVKSAEEIEQIEQALEVAYEMQTTAMKMARPGMRESEVSGTLEGIALRKGAGVSFPIIFSINGQTLHNHYHGNVMQDGDMAVNDSGAESRLHYAADITRTIPVGKKFTEKQKAIYRIVLKANMNAIDAIKPGISYREVHLATAKVIASGLKELGFMKGDLDEAVKQGAQALFFPHGLGHMLGLDVHDLENLGENYVGYDKTIQRSEQFGLAYLRMARELKPGYVMTVEPGIYFIPELIDQWKAGKKFEEFIDYEKVESYRGFGGIRIEDNVLVTESGHRVLGKPIPKTIEEIEALK